MKIVLRHGGPRKVPLDPERRSFLMWHKPLSVCLCVSLFVCVFVSVCLSVCLSLARSRSLSLYRGLEKKPIKLSHEIRQNQRGKTYQRNKNPRLARGNHVARGVLAFFFANLVTVVSRFRIRYFGRRHREPKYSPRNRRQFLITDSSSFTYCR